MSRPMLKMRGGRARFERRPVYSGYRQLLLLTHQYGLLYDHYVLNRSLRQECDVG